MFRHKNAKLAVLALCVATSTATLGIGTVSASYLYSDALNIVKVSNTSGQTNQITNVNLTPAGILTTGTLNANSAAVTNNLSAGSIAALERVLLEAVIATR